MRIISGIYKNGNLVSPKSSKTHPMSEQLRGAIFNTLGDVDGLSILDCFAGSGAIGLEALSRGAKSVDFIENDRPAQLSIAANINTLGVAKQAKLIKTGLGNWLTTSDKTYDIIIADPPYDDIPHSLLPQLAERLVKDGTFVLSWPGKQALPEIPNLATIIVKNYGDAQLVYLG